MISTRSIRTGTNLTLDGGTDAHAQQIATALHQLCDDSTLASCRFDVKSEDRHTFGRTHQVGISQVNGTNSPQLYKKVENDLVARLDIPEMVERAAAGVNRVTRQDRGALAAARLSALRPPS